MSFVEKTVLAVAKFSTETISSFGYFGIFFLMAIESTMIPLPSELIMPFAGYLAFRGDFSFGYIILFSSLGTLFGSLFSYFIGKYGGEPILEKYGKYVLINKKDLIWTYKWFQKRGDVTIFISRFIPVVRHLISLPAGMAQMDLKKFTLYTLIGGTIWNTILAYLGYVLGKNWELVHEYTKPLSYGMVLVVVAGIAYFYYKHIHKTR